MGLSGLLALLLAAPIVDYETERGARDDYRCVIAAVYDLAIDGSIERNAVYSRRYANIVFAVDTATGRMTGRIENHNPFGEPRVISPPGRERAFKVLTIYRAGSDDAKIDLLTIHEYREGPRKPFSFVSDRALYTGSCEWF